MKTKLILLTLLTIATSCNFFDRTRTHRFLTTKSVVVLKKESYGTEFSLYVFDGYKSEWFITEHSDSAYFDKIKAGDTLKGMTFIEHTYHKKSEEPLISK